MKTKKRKERFSKDVFTTDEASFISCPEYVAEHITETILELGDFKSAVELCSCVGSMCIQLGMKLDHVVGIELDPERVEMATKNAELYEVTDKVEFVTGSVLDPEILKNIKADIALLDPGWSTRKFDRSSHVSEMSLTNPDLRKMFDLASELITPNIVTRVPATFSFDTFKEIGRKSKMENIIINDEVVFKVFYFIEGIEEDFEEDFVFE